MVQYQYIALAATAVTAVTAATDKISVQVYRNLEIAKQSNVVVKFHCDEALATHRRRLKSGASRTETIESLVDSLKEHTTKSQASVKSLLANQVESTAVEVATTWIDCAMHVNNASTNLIQKIAALPEVKSIYEPVTMTLDETQSDDKPVSAVNHDIDWGMKKIQAPALWANGIEGEGIVVANIDSGVRYTHESLKSNWRREYGWFDPYNKTNTLPDDKWGHGTSVMGIMVGTKGIGVAPKAKWIACKACKYDCSTLMLVECAQFLLCPHNNDGKKCDPSKAPHVINGSFGHITKDFYLEDMITKWREAGIIPVFAIGNHGLQGCTYSGYPGISPQVIAVGNTDAYDTLAFDSSLGPSIHGVVKPDISAPGFDIRTPGHSSDDSFIWSSGTSMAAPHVSGAIALYLSAKNGASYDQVYRALTENADTNTLNPPNKTCGGIPNTQYPNNLFGHGRLNIFNAVAASISGLTLPPPSESTQVLNPTDDLSDDLSTCGTLEDNTHYIGGDLASFNLTTVESCCAECKRTPRCKLFVWYTLNGGLCRLKDTQGRKVHVDGAKAGVLLAPASGRRP
ncbi:hypothetical protein H257_18226 [Aphanomyces astaci]|uniref:subtilisin n=1 Tax=Aphanomyces astaci TaxID=112090 RepID=W4FDQ7_APHAT|nr:hypothetical protein H257_18226 [Aphanomyces astaci]ETV64971.1 hypothetical protein H257_18226 [Aphanomyces astaci]|eukprot:XP_009845547.1 hypothetical protein H257_18226 [Aphanomyces astaci]